MPLLWPTLVVLLLVLREQSGRKERQAALASGNVDALLEPYPSGLWRWHAGGADTPQVPAVKTPSSRGEVLGAIAQAWRNVTSTEPTTLGVLMLAAQSDLETGSFDVLYNYNLGNLTHATGDGFPWVKRPEVTAAIRFRSYPTLLAGAEDLIRWVQKHNLLSQVAAGDLDGYVAGLKVGCYLGCVGQGNPPVTDSAYADYNAGIVARARLFQNIEPVPPPSPGPPTWALALGAAVLLLGAWWMLGPKLPLVGEPTAKAKSRVKGFAYKIVGREAPKTTMTAVAIDGATGAATVIAADVQPEVAILAAAVADPKASLRAKELPVVGGAKLLPAKGESGGDGDDGAGESCGCEAA